MNVGERLSPEFGTPLIQPVAPSGTYLRYRVLLPIS